MNITSVADFINQGAIESALTHGKRHDRGWFRDCLRKASEPGRLTLREIAALMGAEGEAREELCAAAGRMKESIFGSRVVLFAPLFLSSGDADECAFCGAAETGKREQRWLRLDQVAEQTQSIVEQGHKRVLLIAGETHAARGFRYVLDAIATVYGTKSGPGEVRRVQANLAPPTVEQFYALREARLAEYQCFQVSYHRPTFETILGKTQQGGFDWRATVMHRALASGIPDVRLGVLYGLHDWRRETLAMVQHIRDLEHQFGAGARTISVPRLDAAAANPAYAVNDDDFLKIIAVLRLAIPYAGIAIASHERPELRRKSLLVGVSQMSVGSRQGEVGGQPLPSILQEASELGSLPSFCTACYRVGRTGASYRHLASHPHVISHNCETNALATLLEYLCDYTAGDARIAGEHLIEQQLGKMPATQRAFVTQMLERIRRGERDTFV